VSPSRATVLALGLNKAAAVKKKGTVKIHTSKKKKGAIFLFAGKKSFFFSYSPAHSEQVHPRFFQPLPPPTA
jgi:hypothetical protein